MTDCDTKERKAILQIWPDAYLLICLFHISSNWKNKLNQLLGSHGSKEIIKLRKEVRLFIRGILIKIKTIENNNEVNKECVSEAKNIFEVKNLIIIIIDISYIYILIKLYFIRFD